MNRDKVLELYLIGTMGQILIACMVVWAFRSCGVSVDHSSLPGLVAIVIGGSSSALWGCIATIKYRNTDIKRILYDFFLIKQKISNYLLMMLFLCLDFLPVVFGGRMEIKVWYQPMVLFMIAIVFGGIEELGWRYFFQPTLQERYNYIVSTLITFVAWGIWHFLYFYIEGTRVNAYFFLMGLFTNCFILATLYTKTKNLWLCVMTHSLINVYAQLAVGENEYASYVCRALIVMLAIVVASRKENDNKERMKCKH